MSHKSNRGKNNVQFVCQVSFSTLQHIFILEKFQPLPLAAQITISYPTLKIGSRGISWEFVAFSGPTHTKNKTGVFPLQENATDKLFKVLSIL